MVITKEEYERLMSEHEIGCKTNDYSKMIMMYDDKYIKIKTYEAKYICRHESIEQIQGGQIERCRKCGKEWK